MLSVKPDKPVEGLLVELLACVDRAMRSSGLSYFVGGAFARDLILVHVHGFDVPRPTKDVDVGVAVRNWDDFERIKTRLVDTGEFSAVKGVAHRLMFRAVPPMRGRPLDILPFAGVEEAGAVLRWPPERAVVMNISGFDEAHARAQQVRISDELVVGVASLSGQALLKLAAWLDRHGETTRDAEDLAILFRRYGDAGNLDRLYEEESELLQAAGFDIERAGATLLGQDVRAIATARSYERLSTGFTPAVQDTFLTHVSSGVMVTEDDRVARAKILIDAFFLGLRGGK
jgi:predicted nucleotidyltransferase